LSSCAISDSFLFSRLHFSASAKSIRFDRCFATFFDAARVAFACISGVNFPPVPNLMPCHFFSPKAILVRMLISSLSLCAMLAKIPSVRVSSCGMSQDFSRPSRILNISNVSWTSRLSLSSLDTISV
jgi:hypothetical protein